MTDFTYDELNIILLEMNIVIHRTTKQGIMKISPIFLELRDKVQRMISGLEAQDSCEHKSTNYDDGIYYCDDCGVFVK